MKSALNFFWETGKVIFFALLIVLPVRYFLFQPFLVRGSSMEPQFVESDYLIVEQLTYRFREPKRGEVIVFRYPGSPQRRHIKRIIGLPGERVVIEDGTVFIEKEGEKMSLEEDYIATNIRRGDVDVLMGEGDYFVMGDNRNHSLDSRNWGALPEEYIVGRVLVQISSFTAFARVEAPEY